MKNAWQHVEVLQTTDLPALIHHIASVLEGALALPEVMDALLKKNDVHQRQEVLVFYYLNGLFRHVEDIREHRYACHLLPYLCACGSDAHVIHGGWCSG